MRVKKTGILPKSLILRHTPADYNDAFECIFIRCRAFSPDDVLVAFRALRPLWVKCLFRLRNALVKPFGLKGGEFDDFGAAAEDVIRNGPETDILSVAAKSADETVIVLNDKHLAAYISILLEDAGSGRTRLVCGTLVRLHNRPGRIYFALIKPFHGLVVRAMLKYIVKKLNV